MGISLLAIGSSALAALALAMVAVRKRRSRLDDSYNEFRDSDSVLDGGSEKATEIDDELSLTDLSPTRDVVATPPREGKVAYVVGEEESLYTSAAEARRLAEISFTRVESGNDNSDDLGRRPSLRLCHVPDLRGEGHDLRGPLRGGRDGRGARVQLSGAVRAEGRRDGSRIRQSRGARADLRRRGYGGVLGRGGVPPAASPDAARSRLPRRARRANSLASLRNDS